jgi:glycosyltransferase involved in cell wall biosynthesis
MLRVGLYAPIAPEGHMGGVEQYVTGLASGLRKIQIDSEANVPELEYIFITNPRHPDWIEPHIGGNMTVVPRPWNSLIERIQDALGPLEKPIKPLAKRTLALFGSDERYKIPSDDGFFDDLNLDLVHFVTQHYVKTEKPTLFNPHDLQHLHFPEFFSEQQLAYRNAVYPFGCQKAEIVDTPSQATKKDVVSHYGVDPEHVQPVPLGPAIGIQELSSKSDLDMIQEKYKLPERFMIYPAQTWPHKNHQRLIDAMNYVQENYGERLNLVCTGRKTAHWEQVQKKIKKLSLKGDIIHLGYVDNDDLPTLYELSQFLVLPSLFEGGGLPIFEAWQSDTPVVCSDVTSLPEKGGDAAIYFDPESVDDIGETIYQVWTEKNLRRKLVQRGKIRRKKFTWRRTARLYHALYRSIVGEPLSEADREALRYPENAQRSSLS